MQQENLHWLKFDYADATRLGIDTRGPALLARMRRGAATEFLHVFTFEAGSVAYIWTGARFEPVGVMD